MIDFCYFFPSATFSHFVCDKLHLAKKVTFIVLVFSFMVHKHVRES